MDSESTQEGDASPQHHDVDTQDKISEFLLISPKEAEAKARRFLKEVMNYLEPDPQTITFFIGCQNAERWVQILNLREEARLRGAANVIITKEQVDQRLGSLYPWHKEKTE